MEEPKYYVLNAEGRSGHFLTVDDAVQQASNDDKRGVVPISVACIQGGCGKIIYTARALRDAIAAWRQAHPGE